VALQNHNILPSQFMAMTFEERAFIVGSDKIAYEQMKK